MCRGRESSRLTGRQVAGNYLTGEGGAWAGKRTLTGEKEKRLGEEDSDSGKDAWEQCD